MSDKIEYWETHGKTLSFHPTNDFVAVFYDEETAELVAETVHALGLAEVIEHRCNGRDKDGQPRDHRTEAGEPEIVGLALWEGYWHIVNGMGNFSGLCAKGDDIQDAIGCLNVKFLTKLEAARKAKGGQE